MPLVFIGLGIVFILTGLKGDAGSLWDLVRGDFSGPNNYVYWMISILALGSLGYVESLQKLSRLFIVLVIIVLLLNRNKATGEAAGVTFANAFQGFIATATGQQKSSGSTQP